MTHNQTGENELDRQTCESDSFVDDLQQQKELVVLQKPGQQRVRHCRKLANGSKSKETSTAQT